MDVSYTDLAVYIELYDTYSLTWMLTGHGSIFQTIVKSSPRPINYIYIYIYIYVVGCS